MKHNKNIDIVFKEKIAGFQVQPPGESWDIISSHIHGRRRRIFKTLFIVTAAAASLIIAFISGVFYSRYISEPPKILTTASPASDESKTEPLNTTSDKSAQNNLLYSKTTTGVDNQHYAEPEQISATNNATIAQPEAMHPIKVTTLKKYEQKPQLSFSGQFIENYISSNQIKNEKIKKSDYFISSSIGGGQNVFSPNQPYSGTFESSSSGKLHYDLTTGIHIAKSLTKRLSFRTGIAYSSVSHTSDLFVRSATTSFYQNTPMGTIRTEFGKPFIPDEIISAHSVGGIQGIDGLLVQKLNTFEIPLHFKYCFFNSLINMSFVGGLSGVLIAGNKATFVYNDIKIDVGKTENINTLSFNSSFGVAFDYNINKNFNVSLEPGIKYYLSSLTSADYKPWIFGINSGICYRF